MNENELQKPDYLLAIVPILTFGYPAAAFLIALQYPKLYFQKPLLDSQGRDILQVLFLAIFSAIVLSGWLWKVKLRSESKGEASDLDRLIPAAFFLIDYSLFIFVAWLFDSTAFFKGDAARIWDFTVAFVIIVLIKILFDFHKVPQVYGKLLDKDHGYWSIE